MENRKTYEAYLKSTHRLGRIVSVITLVLLVGAPFAIGALLMVGGLLYFFFKTPRIPLKGKWITQGEKTESSETEIVAIYTDGERFEPVTTELRKKPSVYAIIFFAIVAVFWLIAAIVG